MATKSSIAAAFDFARRLDEQGNAAAARAAYLEVLADDFGHLGALSGLGTLLAREGYTEAARTVLARAVEVAPTQAGLRAALGHLLREAGEPAAARLHYERALVSDPRCGAAHQGLSYLLEDEDPARAERHREAGFADQPLTASPYRGSGRPVRVLQLVCARGGNVVTRHLFDSATFFTHSLVMDYWQDGMALPPHDLVFNAIGDAERSGRALSAAERLLPCLRAPVLNPPHRVRPTGRADNAARLGRLEGVVAPRVEVRERAAIGDGLAFPLLLRSPGFHTGQHFVRVETAPDLAACLAGLPGDELMLIEPLDARGADGFSRKYRVMMVGGALLPLHLAISADWKVHHFTAGMQSRAEHRDEEASFLRDMAGVLGAPAMAALGRIAESLGLDYGGIDFALDPQGRVLLFEANATMVASLPPPEPVWDYRRTAAQAVIAAARDMLRHRALYQASTTAL